MDPWLRRPCPHPRRPHRRALASVGWGKKKFRLRRRRNPLKGLKADKGIQGDPSIFLGWILPDCASAWFGLAKFGSVGSRGVRPLRNGGSRPQWRGGGGGAVNLIVFDHDEPRQAAPLHDRRTARLSPRDLSRALEARRPSGRGSRADGGDAAPRPPSQTPAARRHDLRSGDVRALRRGALCRDPGRDSGGSPMR